MTAQRPTPRRKPKPPKPPYEPGWKAQPYDPERGPLGGRRWSQIEMRWSKGASRLGISYGEYVGHVNAGEKWCSRCKRWQPVGEFGPHKRYGLDTCCLESSRTAAREWQRAHRGERRAS